MPYTFIYSKSQYLIGIRLDRIPTCQGGKKMVSEVKGIGTQRAKEFAEWLKSKHQREEKEYKRKKREERNIKEITPPNDVFGLRRNKKILLFKANVPIKINITRDNPNWHLFRKYILKRDDFKCGLCPNKNNLQIHHIIPVSENINLMYDEDNCLTLCLKCHQKQHPNNNLFKNGET